jgi:predicted  nucleic acid-binding Zn-ribbon protein
MNEQDFQAKLDQLTSQMADLPEGEREKIEALVEETRERHTRMKKCVGQLQESLDYLRLSVKYLVFDLEATRRENKYLRSMLSDQEGDAEGAD